MKQTPPEDLASCRVAIAGLGLMGGSMALALRGKCARLLAVDPDPSVIGAVLDRHIVDQAAIDPAEILPYADLVILAAPVFAILDMLERLSGLCPGPAMVLDIGSTKSLIVKRMQALPERFDPMGGHPMCGKELGGLSNAEAALFNTAAFALTPLDRSSKKLRQIIEELVFTVGSHPIYLDPETHDRLVASTSHLPFLVANALAAVIPEPAGSLVGPGLRSTTRLAPTSWSMMGDILMSNRANVQAVLRRFYLHMQEIEQLIACEDMNALGILLEKGADRYNQIIRVKN